MFFVLFRAVLMGDLRSWVSDRLMSLLGYSQSTVVQYVISICKSVMFFLIYMSVSDAHVSFLVEVESWNLEKFSYMLVLFQLKMLHRQQK